MGLLSDQNAKAYLFNIGRKQYNPKPTITICRMLLIKETEQTKIYTSSVLIYLKETG